ASTADFQRIVEQHAGLSMDWFFQQWVYGTAIPTYRVAYKTEPAGNGQYRVKLRVAQEGVPDDFRTYVPVALDLGNNRVARVWVILFAWTAWGLLWSAEVTVSSRLGGKPIPFDVALRIQMPLALAWALVTPAIIWLGRRVPPFGSPQWPLGVAVNLVSSIAVVFGLGVFFIVNTRAVQGVSPDAPPLLLAALRSFVYWFSSDGLLYWVIL